MKPVFQAIGVGFAAALWIFVFSTPLQAQDVATIAGVSAAPGATVNVPIYIRDLSGTPLGIDQPAGNKIQAFSFFVSYTPAAAVSSITFVRGGITASLTPAFEMPTKFGNTVSYILFFDETTALVPFSLNPSPPGNQVATLVVHLAPSATLGTVVNLTWGSGLTELLNQGTTISENLTDGNLALINGSITVSDPVLTPALSPFGFLACAILLAVSGLILMKKRRSV